MGVRRGIDRTKVGCKSLIDANFEGQVGVNKFKLYINMRMFISYITSGTKAPLPQLTAADRLLSASNAKCPFF